MKKIVTCGILADNNFGCPSILHGIGELFKQLSIENYKIINFQNTPIIDLSVSDMCFETKQIAIPIKKFLFWSILYRFGIKHKNKNFNEQIEIIKTADLIIDLYGICFCDNFNKERFRPILNILKMLHQFTIPFIGKMFGVATLKNISSYGPMEKKNSVHQAKIADKFIFDYFLAREKESLENMINVAKISKQVKLSPDIANLMKLTKSKQDQTNVIGISISYQIINQWKSPETYISCITNLIKHIYVKYDFHISLIPNEVSSIYYNDEDVGNELIERLHGYTDRVSLLDVKNITSSELKNKIARCEFIVASRYHSCVAALSAGVPLLVVGWHHKYDELLNYYDQKEWIISSDNCKSIDLCSKFDKLVQSKDEVMAKIQDRQYSVKQQIIKTYEQALSALWG